MAFFRKWKLHYKHKKLSDDWALASSMKNLSEAQLNDELDCNINKSNKENHHNDDYSNISAGITTFDLKYLGSTSIDSEKSQKSTADAIKSVISLSKLSKRKNQRVKLMVSPQGIDVINPNNGETLLHVSIYKISYCSADAVHDHVFAFVGTDDDNNNQNNIEKLSCHVFYCPKRKIAHDVTLTVAKCFENAYEVWRETVNRKMMKDNNLVVAYNNHNEENLQIENQQIHQNKLNNKNNITPPLTTPPSTVKENPTGGSDNSNNSQNNDETFDLLIDLTPSDIRIDLFEKDNRKYLQNTWVSFDDDNSNHHQSNDLGSLIVCS